MSNTKETEVDEKFAMDYQIALEACRAYKECSTRLRLIGLDREAGNAGIEERYWRKEYVRLADKQQASNDIE